MHIRSRTDDFAGFDRPSGGQLQRAASSTDSSSSLTVLALRVGVDLARREEQLDHGLVPVPGRPRERRLTDIVLRVGVDPSRAAA
jgi:hypothetical protein